MLYYLIKKQTTAPSCHSQNQSNAQKCILYLGVSFYASAVQISTPEPVTSYYKCMKQTQKII